MWVGLGKSEREMMMIDEGIMHHGGKGREGGRIGNGIDIHVFGEEWTVLFRISPRARTAMRTDSSSLSRS